MKKTGTITRISGPLVEASGMEEAKMFEVVYVSKERLLGEIIVLEKGVASIQVYEDTSGITPGDIVERTNTMMSVELGPGLLTSIYDGIQRPLSYIEKVSQSHYIKRGIKAPGIDRDAQWEFKPLVKTGDTVVAGDVLGEVQETSLIVHKIMVPPQAEGTVKNIKQGKFTVEEIVAVIKTKEGDEQEIALLSRWPIRAPRPFKKKIFPNAPLITGIRTIDSLFPIAKGGVAAIPGPFGSGKTVTQQSLAKYCDAQVIVYVGCGERGNEMTEVLNEFPHLIDPNSGEPLIRRTVLIANTSNMPVAAREASVYTGITIAEYYRDMGYSVALMADSTSRWAEAMREMSGRLEEMPGEEGYPAYLSSRTSEFYERAGLVKLLGNTDREGALTVIGAVSPPGGDLSEPVSQATLRVTKVFWGLDADLAYKKHFPSINWLNSYSLYADNIKNYWRKEIANDFPEVRTKIMSILQEEAKLMEIVRLVGLESVSDEERITLDIARVIREDFLFQNAFDAEDAYTPLIKQYEILNAILFTYHASKNAIKERGLTYKAFLELKILEKLSGARLMPADNRIQFETLRAEIKDTIHAYQS